MESISSLLLRRSHSFEPLEARQLLTATPELVADMDTTPARVYSSAIWESVDNQAVWIQNGYGRPRTTGVQVHLLDQPSGRTLIEEIQGRLTPDTHKGSERLTFSAESTSGTAFWTSDGTKDGTRMLGEVVNLVDSVHPLGLRKNDDDSFTLFHVGANALEDLVKVDLSFDEFNGDPVQVGDLWYVRLQRSGVGNEIWVTDGTSEGTRRIPANVPGPLVSFQGALFFQASADNGQRAIFRLDDPNAAPEMAVDIGGTELSPDSGVYGATEDLLFGATRNADGQFEYWVAGEDLVPQEAFGSFGSAPSRVEGFGFYFDFSVGNSRYRSDGTKNGTTLISSSTSPIEQYVLDGNRYVLSRDGITKQLVVVQDDVSTVLVSDLGFNAKFVDDEDGKLYIASKEELWSTDGTVEGTRVEFEIHMQAYAIDQGVIAGDNFFYSNRFDVWQSDFTQTAPVIKVDNTVTKEDHAELIGRSGETLYYRAGFRRTSLWAVDGASAVEVLRLPTGQSIVHDSVSPFYEDQPPRNTTIDGWFYFLVDESESEQSLRRTRGTPETTETIGVLPAGEVTFTSVDDTLTMFIRQRRPDGGWSSEDGTQLWVSDVDDGSVRMVAEQIPHSSSRFLQSMPESFNGKLYFPVSEDDCAGCLWSSDFTVDGTRAVSSAESIQNIYGVRQVAESLFFVSWRGELFRLQADDSLVSVGIKLDNGNPCCTQTTSVSDRYVTVTNSEDSEGTLTRTVVSTNGLEADVMEVPRSATLLSVVGDRIHYRIQNEDSQFEYYSSDGTTDGTRLYFRESVQYEFVPLEEGVIQRLQLGGDTVSFFTDDGTYVYLRTSDDVIWKSDGTAEQTHILTDVSDFAIPYGGGGGTFHASSTHLFFTATTKDVSDSLFRVSTSIGPLVGDVDQDWDVDFADFLQLSMNFGRDVDVLFKDGDLNEDGRITFEDFLLLSAGFGTDLSRRVT